jgi:Macrocin-O-methyltransferase (TylF)
LPTIIERLPVGTTHGKVRQLHNSGEIDPRDDCSAISFGTIGKSGLDCVRQATDCHSEALFIFEALLRCADSEAVGKKVIGVYKGHSIRFWSQMNRDPQSRFIGFDSFEGLPEDFTKKFTKATFDLGGAMPQIDDERVSFVKGWFQTTLPGFLNGFTPKSRLVVHNDGDLYSSTLFTLASLTTLLVPGTVLIFDEYSHLTHEFRAFADYRSAFWRSAHPVAMTSDYSVTSQPCACTRARNGLSMVRDLQPARPGVGYRARERRFRAGRCVPNAMELLAPRT